jgi:uncharacterized protein YkwD
MRAPFAVAVALSAALAAVGVLALPRERTAAQAPRLEAAPALQGPWVEYVAPVSACPGGNHAAESADAQQRTMVCLVDFARLRRGLAPLVVSGTLLGSAALKARDIAACERFAHDPCGTGSRRVFELVAYGTGSATWGTGENLAMVSANAATPRYVMNGWLNSQPHREDLFQPDWTEQGVALVAHARVDGHEDVNVWASHFGFRNG